MPAFCKMHNARSVHTMHMHSPHCCMQAMHCTLYTCRTLHIVPQPLNAAHYAPCALRIASRTLHGATVRTKGAHCARSRQSTGCAGANSITMALWHCANTRF